MFFHYRLLNINLVIIALLFSSCTPPPTPETSTPPPPSSTPVYNTEYQIKLVVNEVELMRDDVAGDFATDYFERVRELQIVMVLSDSTGRHDSELYPPTLTQNFEGYRSAPASQDISIYDPISINETLLLHTYQPYASFSLIAIDHDDLNSLEAQGVDILNTIISEAIGYGVELILDDSFAGAVAGGYIGIVLDDEVDRIMEADHMGSYQQGIWIEPINQNEFNLMLMLHEDNAEEEDAVLRVNYTIEIGSVSDKISDCGNGEASDIYSFNPSIVTLTQDGLDKSDSRLYQTASINSSQVNHLLTKADKLEVIGLPICVEERVWWQLQLTTEKSITGFFPEKESHITLLSMANSESLTLSPSTPIPILTATPLPILEYTCKNDQQDSSSITEAVATSSKPNFDTIDKNKDSRASRAWMPTLSDLGNGYSYLVAKGRTASELENNKNEKCISERYQSKHLLWKQSENYVYTSDHIGHCLSIRIVRINADNIVTYEGDWSDTHCIPVP